jgi:hypothetical protein
MLDEGYTLDGAAQALGWTRQLVTARAKILKLSAAGQQLVGTGEIPVSAIDVLLAIADVSPAIAEALVASIATGDIAGSQLVNNAGWAIGQALRHVCKDTFGAYLNTVQHRDLNALRLGKKTDALVAEAEKLHKQVEQYSYGPPTFRFATADTDQARAAGVLIELDGSNPIITDLALYRELAKQAIARTVEQLRERAAAKASGKRAGASKRERTPREELDVEHRATLRELTRQAHGTNLDLGTQLLTELAAVAPDDMDVARFFALGLLGPESGNYLGRAITSRERSPLTGCGSSSMSTARRRPRRSRAASPARRRSPTAMSTSPPSGCGGSSTERRRPASCTAACSSCSPLSATRASSSCPTASAAARYFRAPTRTSRERRSSA